MFVLGMWDGGDVVLIFKFGVDLKGLFFFWEQLLFLGHGLFLVLGRVCEGFTCFGGTPTEHVATRLVQVDFVDFVLGHVVRLLYLLCPKTH